MCNILLTRNKDLLKNLNEEKIKYKENTTALQSHFAPQNNKDMDTFYEE